MELKFMLTSLAGFSNVGFNRTFMELKLTLFCFKYSLMMF